MIYLYNDLNFTVLDGQITSGLSYVTYAKDTRIYTIIFHFTIITGNKGFHLFGEQRIDGDTLKIKGTAITKEKMPMLNIYQPPK